MTFLKFDFSAKPSACELRVAQYEKPLTKGHCPKHKTDPDRKDPEKVAKKRSERKERSHVLKEKIVKLIESGLQLSEYQARKVILLIRETIEFLKFTHFYYRHFRFICIVSYNA